MKKILLFSLFLAAPAWAQVEIGEPWARATAPGAKVAAGYLVVRNKAPAAERLLSATSPAAVRVETHVTVKDGDIMRMREVKGYAVPANGSLELKPGGSHLMFIDIRQPFKEGDKLPVVLKFQRAGELKVEFRVGRLGAAAAGHAH